MWESGLPGGNPTCPAWGPPNQIHMLSLIYPRSLKQASIVGGPHTGQVVFHPGTPASSRKSS
ncbi:hypothetical protein DPMN_162015 [Dreissena polymorpha]|uniref:Uncharacterized protein n=1 Tax=Dreissena polymorpha TaxID=45954 RepID=A0A9D4EQX2_DREPO|nr:hypothetical protein DPMN_162015 [Dreissena polymorpha]